MIMETERIQYSIRDSKLFFLEEDCVKLFGAKAGKEIFTTVKWSVPTCILYGSKDDLVSLDTISDFAKTHNVLLTVMEGGEHWFHTEEQMAFLDNWIKNEMKREI